MTKLKKLILVALILNFAQHTMCAQENGNIEIQFLTAQFNDTIRGKDVMVVFILTTKDSASFPPVINLPPKCTVFENGLEKIVFLGPNNLNITLYGNDIEVKDKPLYDKIKHLLHFHPIKPQMIIVYYLKDLNYVFKKMTFTPGFKEKLNKEIRFQKKFEFEVN